MRIQFLTLTTFLCASFGAVAQSESRMYLQLDVGPAFQENLRVRVADSEFDLETREGVRLDFTFGYKIRRYLAAELESGLIYTRLVDFGQHRFYQVPVMANLVWNYPGHKFTPFVGAGLGGVGIIADPRTGGQIDTDFVFGCQPLAGFRYRSSKNLERGLGYRLLVATPMNFPARDFSPGVHVGSSLTHSLTALLVYSF
jgi:opacity protein-like surface antigen